MRACIFTLLLMVFFQPLISYSADKAITVTVTGYGVNDQVALEDAFQNAVRKVTGVYVVTQSMLKNDDLSEEIYLNADAVISSHKLLRRSIEHGIIRLDIEATVVKNQFTQFIKKHKNHKVSSTDIRNLMNRRKALNTALKSIELILHNETRNIFRISKIGQLELDADDNSISSNVKVTVNYQVEFNQEAYKAFAKKLANVLDKFCIKKEQYINTGKRKYSERDIANIFLKKYQKDNSQRAIIFCDFRTSNRIIYTCYLVPFQVFKKTYQRFFGINANVRPLRSVIGVQIRLKNGNFLTKIFSNNIGFHDTPDNFSLDYWKYVCFFNRGYHNNTWFSESSKSKFEIEIPQDQIEKITQIALFSRHGIEGHFLKTLRYRDLDDMETLAYARYIPAMISLAENFKYYNWWKHAAWLGSSYAQERLGWKNHGLGIEVWNFDIISTCRELKHLQGKKITSINQQEDISIRTLSQIVGQTPAGKSVTLGFSDGTFAHLIARGKFNPAISQNKPISSEVKETSVSSEKPEQENKNLQSSASLNDLSQTSTPSNMQQPIELMLPISLPGNIDLQMVKINAGNFTMGSSEDENGRFSDEKQHKVSISKNYWIGTFEITQEQYQAVMKKNPSLYKHPKHPVENVTWFNAKKFCQELTRLYADKLPPGYRFDLPTEAQWEYACRAETTTALNTAEEVIFPSQQRCPNLNRAGWFRHNNIPRGHKKIGLKKANNWGIFDCHGNIGEWCRDWYTPYSEKSVDPLGPLNGRYRVYRGGHWNSFAKDCRSASRHYKAPMTAFPFLGFRVAIVNQ